ncbi:MAG: hypothetical protein Q4C96_06355 [Planctomycetia bacterium]|nr:hypothetical protein [Planctomycetia bacterium]
MKTRILFSIFVFLLIFCVQTSVFSQSLLEMSPYNITIILTVEPNQNSSEITAHLKSDLENQINSRIGGAWNVTFMEPPGSLAGNMINNLDSLQFSTLPENILGGDKVIFLAVRFIPDTRSYKIFARELDVRMQTFSSIYQEEVPVSWKLGSCLFHSMMSVFAPISIIESLDGEKVTLRVRAANLPTPEKGILLMKPGMVGMPIVRYNNAKGVAQKIQPVIWTFLVVEELQNRDVFCKLETGIRSPLSNRRRGRIEQTVLAIHPTQKSTILRLTSRQERGKPLAGYAVYTLGTSASVTPENKNRDLLPEELKPADTLDKKTGKKLYLVGRTNRHGEIEIPPQKDSPLALVIVKSGATILAKLPIIPGQEPFLTAEIPDMDMILETESINVGLQQELVDMVASRQIYLARAKTFLEEDDVENAKKMLAEIRLLPTREVFERTVLEKQKEFYSSEKNTQKQIEKMFTETLVLMAKFYDNAPINELEEQIRLRETVIAAENTPQNKKPSEK